MALSADNWTMFICLPFYSYQQKTMQRKILKKAAFSLALNFELRILVCVSSVR